ncbi:hypothetical protein PENSPDRAFT_645113 [Peniophora sp. CONT]|nr:hypothetical protein PENSPDRAFT_645113 [Peniophora sp. CONT]
MHPVVPLLFSLALPALVHGFSFSTNQPTSCGNLEVTWTGGTAPFTLTIFGAFQAAFQVSVPADAFSNGKGSFSTPLPLAGGTNFVAAMSDATGFATGGISPTISTGAAVNGATCGNTTHTPQWVYDTPSQATQCRAYPITGINPNGVTPTYPITILTIVPGGTFQNYTVTSGATFTIPLLDIQAGSTLLVSTYDAAGRNGGDSDFLVVAQSGDSSCLSSKYLSSTVVSTSSSTATATSASSSSTATSTSSADSATTVSGGTIGAIVAASIVGLGALAAIGFFCWKRNSGKRRYARNRVDMAGDYDEPTLLATTSRRYEPDPFTLGAPNTEPFDWNHSAPTSATDLMATSGEVGAAAGAGAAASRYSYASHQPGVPSRHSTYSTGPATSLAPTTRSGKTNATGATRATQPRFIMHTDAADETTEEPEEVIELPPQYTERRRLPEYGGEGSSSDNPPLGDVKRR